MPTKTVYIFSLIVSIAFWYFLTRYCSNHHVPSQNSETTNVGSSNSETVKDLLNEGGISQKEAILDELIDAQFVSHGVEIAAEEPNEAIPIPEDKTEDIQEPEENVKVMAATPETNGSVAEIVVEAGHFEVVPKAKNEPIQLNHDSMAMLLQGNWLVLTHAAKWCPHSKTLLSHFLHNFSRISKDALNLAVIDANADPLAASILQVTEYPNLTLVTEDGRIRPWPFVSMQLTQSAEAFLNQERWKQLPVYQMIRLRAPPHFIAIQMKIFNWIQGKLVPSNLKLIQFARRNPFLGLASIPTLWILNHKFHYTRYILA